MTFIHQSAEHCLSFVLNSKYELFPPSESIKVFFDDFNKIELNIFGYPHIFM